MWALISQKATDHFMFPSLSDPADVVTVLLSDAISHIGTNFLQYSSSNAVCHSKILRVARCAHPAKWTEAQRENVTVEKNAEGRERFIARGKDQITVY